MEFNMLMCSGYFCKKDFIINDIVDFFSLLLSKSYISIKEINCFIHERYPNISCRRWIEAPCNPMHNVFSGKTPGCFLSVNDFHGSLSFQFYVHKFSFEITQEKVNLLCTNPFYRNIFIVVSGQNIIEEVIWQPATTIIY